MDFGFWHKRWENNEIGFHLSEVNLILVEHFQALKLEKGSRIFVPLCGKSLDIGWLLSNDYQVAGIELSQLAIDQLCHDLGITPNITEIGKIKHYQAKNLNLFIGDFWALSQKVLGHVDAIYDRAALVALPQTMRCDYTQHLMKITANAPQLLVAFEYDQSQINGPPFAVPPIEVNQHYNANYQLTRVANIDIPGGLKGKCPAKEQVWILKPA